METLTFDTLRRNAFRTLGLSGAATQEQIESAARMMRLYGGGDVPPTPRDAAWLGPVPRAVGDIESALTRLTDPETRVQERVWWYCSAPPGTDGARTLRAGASPVEEVCHRHDEALTSLLGALIAGNDAAALRRWNELLPECHEIARSDEYLQWMAEVENDGAFEKPATLEEIARKQREFADRAATALVALADERLAEGDFRGAGRVLSTLRHSGGEDGSGAGQSAATIERIVERFDDALTGQCNEQIALVNEAWKTKQVHRLKPACIRALSACEQTIGPLAEELAGYLEDEYRAERMRGQVAAVYVHVADAYEACHDKYSARGALMKSLPLAAGTAMEPRIRARIEELTGSKPVREGPVRQNAGSSSGGGSGGGGGLRFFSGGRSLGWLVAVLISIVLRMCLWNSSSTTRRSSYENDQPTYQFSDEQTRALVRSLNTQQAGPTTWLYDSHGNPTVRVPVRDGPKPVVPGPESPEGGN